MDLSEKPEYQGFNLSASHKIEISPMSGAVSQAVKFRWNWDSDQFV